MSYKIKYISKSILQLKKKLWCRSTLLTKEYENITIFVHNGLKFSKILLKKKGSKLGEFSMTRKIPIHPVKKKKSIRIVKKKKK